MTYARRLSARAGYPVLLLALLLTAVSACSGSSSRASGTPKLNVPKDPAPVTVVAGQATTLDLGGGADLIIPPGAMTPGATVRATFQGRPAGNWPDSTPVFAPVKLVTNPADAIHGLLTLEFPVDPTSIVPGVDPAMQFGISTFDDGTRTWTPVASTYDPARHKVVALIQHFSWWNPFTWDFHALLNSVVQGFGKLAGTRSPVRATCTGSAPAWVAGLDNSTDQGDNVPMYSCGQSQGSILDVQMVNNRPYGQILTYGSGVKWGWHEEGESVSDIARNFFMDHQMAANQLYLPPLARASVGIFQPPAGARLNYQIWPTPLSIAADLFFYLLGTGIDKIPLDGHCLALDTESSLKSVSPGALRDDLAQLAQCVEQGFTDLIKSGALDKVAVSKYVTLFGVIRNASVVGQGIQLAGGITWKIADLIADWAGNRNSAMGNGYTVLAEVAVPPTVTPTPPTVTPPTVTPPQPQPVNAYDNYGQTNLWGHSMCRGNPANSLSMPGGTGTQTFLVPAGVASLSSAEIQIDPAPVTAQLQVAVNGVVEATTSAAAVGDTYFSFGPVSVHAGDTVTLTITFSATAGKIITLYTVGSGVPGGVFTSRNTCPDGASNDTVTNGALRAVVSGLS